MSVKSYFELDYDDYSSLLWNWFTVMLIQMGIVIFLFYLYYLFVGFVA